ncbi:hypothetical protein DK926_09905 [Rhodococcus sp. Eu-32]|uniref:DUF6928 family protein n=1 Tax=Rhodococcus sp. Eu-32 TaxID=1017319 RepID=UPI000DF14AC6|nr:hypothetical protein [Rhodococcus sp. Eu-32]RRQ28179.1 hypothetical protein DK926_09905 [Rhodococcus sp. Eu-32]
MGAKASTIWYVDTPDPISVLRQTTSSHHDAATALVGSLFADKVAVPTQQAPISKSASVGVDEVAVGSYPGVTVVCSTRIADASPASLSEHWSRPLASEKTYLIATDPETAWGAFAYWERGSLRRSFSATPIYIYEDIGLPLVWERPFWAGEHPLVYPPGVMPDPQSLPFHPQEFAEAANAHWLGFRYTGAPRGEEFDPNSLPVSGFSLYTPGEEPTAAPAPAPASERSFKRWWRRKSPAQRS